VQIVTYWKLTLSYDGTGFHGWQVQPGLLTVQGTLMEAIERVTGEIVLPQGSGRTDAGVHALAQVASLALEAAIPPPNFLRALNSVLPPSIRVTNARHVAPDFHARHRAVRKTYEYRIFERRDISDAEAGDRVCPPFLAPYVWDCRWPLDLDRMKEAAAHLLGEHDFASFAASDPDRSTREQSVDEQVPQGFSPGSHRSAGSATEMGFSPWDMPSVHTTRSIFHSHLHRKDHLLIYRIAGNGFLHHMVRNIVGTLADVGRGSLAPADILRILAARDRSTAGPTAPACGLFLVSVEYPDYPEAQP
jgi:tRNA pseudouridine38-40 synthase